MIAFIVIDILQVMGKVKLSGEASIGEVSMNEYASSTCL